MSMKKIAIRRFCVPFAMVPLFFGCSTTSSVSRLPTDVVALVNGHAISKVQLDNAVLVTGKPDTPALRKMIKGQLIERELVRQQAEAERYDLLPEVQEAMRTAKIDSEIEHYLRDHVHAAPVGEEELRARYDARIAELGPKEYKTRILIIGDDAIAATVAKALRAGVDFQELARRYSLAPNKNQGGELPWLNFKSDPVDGQTHGLSLPVARAIIRLSPGEMTYQPIAVGEARVFVKLDNVRPATAAPYQTMKPLLQRELERKVREQATAQLLRKLADRADIVE
ncbi:peptidyl-prolyl cis-trans isomerase [Burkholderia ubonensis]|uniref:peptidyl-prolyl cis-trans isomerase n=1 Tax=Burkholderia ubonensis TaxID=101571 RepID=UPI0009B43761|nr:peptidyl-prolyl cis-trans isomerase [Burkholderia ubonensis]